MLIPRGPIWEGEWRKGLPFRIRIQSVIAGHALRLNRLLMWSVAAFATKQGAKRYGQEAALGRLPDMRGMEKPEIQRLFDDSVRHGLKQGVEAFCQEWPIMKLDMAGEAGKPTYPIHLLDGVQGRLLLPVFSHRFAVAVPQTRLDIPKSPALRDQGNDRERVHDMLDRTPMKQGK